jgi:electron transfer flavoprotein alpha/beta subunit
MNIIVCIKQVPETQEVRLDPVTHTLKREGIAAIINPFDLYALEEGLRVKDAHGGTVTVITMGPPQAEAALREALGFGADAAVLLSDKAFAGADTWATALTLARAVEKLGAADLIFCGKQAIDGDTAQVGPMLATILDIPSRWNASWTTAMTRSRPVSRPSLRWSRRSTNPGCRLSRPNSRPRKPPSRCGASTISGWRPPTWA